MRNRAVTATQMGPLSALSQNQIDQYTQVPTTYIRPSITDKARTITHVCSSGTLCTSSVMKDVEGYPFGSYVDFIADENGHPVMLISNQSLHTQNLRHNPSVSLFCQLPRQVNNQASASLSRVTIMGKVEHVPPEELPALQTAFTLIHPYSEQIIESPKFKLLRIKPEKIYFSGGFGVLATWVNVQEYEQARADVLATEVPSVLARVNMDKQGELLLLCKHFLGITDVEVVRVQAIDRLGIDLRIKTGKIWPLCDFGCLFPFVLRSENVCLDYMCSKTILFARYVSACVEKAYSASSTVSRMCSYLLIKGCSCIVTAPQESSRTSTEWDFGTR